MLKDFKASKMFTLLRNGCAVAEIARRLTVSEKTIRTYRDRDLLPSQVERAPRTHRTRVDPLEAFWPEIEALLKSDPQLKPITVLGWLQQKHNLPESDPSEQVVPDSLRRTLERRIHKWKIQHDVQQEVVLPQVHLPGDVIAFDFVDLNVLGVTLNGQQFDHKLFHATLTYSNWQHIHLCYSESFQALSTGLQDALHLIGGVPRRVRSDSLSAAVNNLSSDKEFAKQYQGLLNHYGLKGHRINVGKPQENGDVESANGHLKTAIDQALRLRGNRDFEDVNVYREFVQSVVAQRNKKRTAKLCEEVEHFTPLPQQRMVTYTSLQVHVKSDCVVNIKRNQYSVNSKYRDRKLDVRIHQDTIELWYQGERMEVMPRLTGRGKELIDFRHVIDSLVRKPGAFANYRYQSHMYPTTRFRLAYDTLRQNTSEASAVKQYLEILHAAKHEGLDTVDEILQSLLTSGGEMTAAVVLALIASRQQLPSPMDMDIPPPDLTQFDDLLLDKDAYDDQEVSSETRSLDSSISCSEGIEPRLDDYDAQLRLSPTTEGPASADDAPVAHSSSRTGSSRSVVALAVPNGTDEQRVRVSQPESGSPLDAKLAITRGQNVGTISMVAVAAACHSEVRSSAQRIVLGSTGERADIRESRIRENHVAFGFGGSTSSSRSLGTVHHMPNVGSGTSPGKTRSTAGTSDQEAEQVRSAGHRRSGLCATESRRDGSIVHSAIGALRTRKCTLEFESSIQQMGTDLQGSDDNGSSCRPSHPSLSDHRVTEDQKLSTGRGPIQINSTVNRQQGYKKTVIEPTEAREF